MMQKIETVLGLLLGALLGLMVLDVTWQILTRFLPMQPSSYTEEIARYLLVWIGLLGAAYAYRKQSHLGIDLLSNALHGRPKRLLQLFVVSVCLVFASMVMVYGGAKLVLLTFELEQRSAALNLPMGYVYSVLPLSGLLISVFALDQLLQLIANKPQESAIGSAAARHDEAEMSDQPVLAVKQKSKPVEPAVEA
uniref:TRAP transporter small permease n=1 Tax=Microbulbifer agarilyticus TaxID=260552 RepID=UPI0002559D3A|nr:TRAP transporter small permease [Microbulbifer agarilyticus]